MDAPSDETRLRSDARVGAAARGTLAGPVPSVLIASLSYSPGLAKEVVAFGAQLERHGAEVTLLLSNGYGWFAFPPTLKVRFSGRGGGLLAVAKQFVGLRLSGKLRAVLRDTRPGFVLAYNPHPANGYLLRRTRKLNPPALTAVFLHEPYKPERRSMSLRGRLVQKAVEWAQSRLLPVSDFVILPSEVAGERFVLRHPYETAKVRRCNLVIPDAGPARGDADREYFTYVGHITPDTGFDRFLEIADLCSSTRRPWRFGVVTSSALPPSINRGDRRGIEVIRETPLTEERIDEMVRRSLAVMRFEKDITQSGVVPVAFRNATPVIAPDLPGFAQHITDRANGRLYSPEASNEDIVRCMEWVILNPRAREAARRTYEDLFSPTVWPRYYAWLMSLLCLKDADVPVGR